MGGPEPHPGERLRRLYSFGDFTLDPHRRVLRRGDEEISLRPKSLDVLIHLLEHHGHVVTKTTLMEAVWADTAVTENSLPQCLVEIRRALGDDSQQVILTVARRGYLFAEPVTTPVLENPQRLPVNAAEPPPVPTTGSAPRANVALRGRWVWATLLPCVLICWFPRLEDVAPT